MAGLVKRLQGKPFHLIHSDNQNKGKAEMMAYLKSKGFDDSLSNFTLSQFAGHDAVKGNGHVPYYFVFDHTGALRFDNMCGAYHGGDGMKCIEWVDKLLAEAPAIYCGAQPFVRHAALAKKIEGKLGLAAAVAEVEKALPTAEGDAKVELERLLAAATAYRDRTSKRAHDLESTDPVAALPALKALATELKGTEIGKPVAADLEALAKSKDYKAAVDIGKHYATARKTYEAEAAKAKDPTALAGLSKSLVAHLNKVTKGREDLPISKTIAAWLVEIGATK